MRRSVSRSARRSARIGANNSEADRKSSASESSSGIGCSSYASPRAKRWHQPRNDVIADQIGQALLQIQWLAHTTHVSRVAQRGPKGQEKGNVGSAGIGRQRK
jgi:hypothetical protein